VLSRVMIIVAIVDIDKCRGLRPHPPQAD